MGWGPELRRSGGSRPPFTTNLDGMTLLIIASFCGRVGIVHRLLHHSSVLSTINHCDSNGWMGLYHASWEGYPNIVRMLLEAGADTTIRSSEEEIASEEGHQGCINLLKVGEACHKGRRKVNNKSAPIHSLWLSCVYEMTPAAGLLLTYAICHVCHIGVRSFHEGVIHGAIQ